MLDRLYAAADWLTKPIDRALGRLGRWIGLELHDDVAVSLRMQHRPALSPRIGESYARYCDLAERADRRALTFAEWCSTADEDEDGTWITRRDATTQAVEELLSRGVKR